MAKKKTICPISRPDFKAQAQPVEITINGEAMTVPVKEFSTGSLGWYLNRRATLLVGGTEVPVQIGLNLTIVGSKDLPREPGAQPQAAAQDEGEDAMGEGGGADASDEDASDNGASAEARPAQENRPEGGA